MQKTLLIQRLDAIKALTDGLLGYSWLCFVQWSMLRKLGLLTHLQMH